MRCVSAFGFLRSFCSRRNPYIEPLAPEIPTHNFQKSLLSAVLFRKQNKTNHSVACPATLRADIILQSEHFRHGARQAGAGAGLVFTS